VSQDKVRFEDQERVDRPDMDALQALVYKYASGMLGGVLGPASGLLTPLSWTKSNDGVDYFLTLDRLVVCHTVQTETRVEDQAGGGGAVNVGTAWDSVVHTFAPGDAGHDNHPVKYTAARAAEMGGPGGTKPYVWCRPQDVPADVDTRRIWNVATGAESPLAMATRNRQRLMFEVSTEKPAIGAGADWVAIARVWTWVDNQISVLYGISAWDDPDLHALTEEGGVVEDPSAESASFAYPLQRLVEGSVPGGRFDGTVNTWPPGTRRSGGIMYALHWVRSRLRRHISQGTYDPAGTVTRPWWELPELSLNGAYKWLTTNTTNIVANAAAALLNKNHLTRNVTLCAGVLQFHAAGIHAAPYNVVGWALMHGWGIESVAMGGTERTVIVRFKDSLITGREGWYISGVTCAPVYGPGVVANPSGFQLNAHMIPDAYATPAGFSPGDLSAYAGAAVGLAAGQYGIRLEVSQLVETGAVLDGVLPADGVINDIHAWAVNVVISKFKPGDAGV